METNETMEYNNTGYESTHDNTGVSHNSKLWDFYGTTSNFNDENIMNLNYVNILEDDKSLRVCIIVPTYNEASNIPKLLDILFSEEQQLKYVKENVVMNVLVVDDNSPDGTADIVKTYKKDNSHIHLLSRNEKNGLGAAYIAGMQHAMVLLKPDVIFEMDGDLSHGPEYIIPMIIKVKEGADFVIGSRYVKGGSIPENWGFKRKLISRSANFYAKTILRIKDVNDCTGGFRAIRTSALEQIDLNSLKTKGYAFQISLLEEMRRNNVVMREVPIAFKDRTNGTSKMKMQDIMEEGLFVLKASLQNIFSPKKRILATIPNKEFWSITENSEHKIEFRQTSGLTETSGLAESQLEFNEAFGLTEKPLEMIENPMEIGI